MRIQLKNKKGEIFHSFEDTISGEEKIKELEYLDTLKDIKVIDVKFTFIDSSVKEIHNILTCAISEKVKTQELTLDVE